MYLKEILGLSTYCSEDLSPHTNKKGNPVLRPTEDALQKEATF